jgi:hypothetical protein
LRSISILGLGAFYLPIIVCWLKKLVSFDSVDLYVAVAYVVVVVVAAAPFHILEQSI